MARLVHAWVWPGDKNARCACTVNLRSFARSVRRKEVRGSLLRTAGLLRQIQNNALRQRKLPYRLALFFITRFMPVAAFVDKKVVWAPSLFKEGQGQFAADLEQKLGMGQADALFIADLIELYLKEKSDAAADEAITRRYFQFVKSAVQQKTWQIIARSSEEKQAGYRKVVEEFVAQKLDPRMELLGQPNDHKTLLIGFFASLKEFFKAQEETKFLGLVSNDLMQWLFAVYREKKSGGKRFVSELVRIMDVAKNVQHAKENLLRPGLKSAGLSQLMPAEVFFGYDPRSQFSADIVNGRLRINYYKYAVSESRQYEFLETLLYDIYFHIIYADQMREGSFAYFASRPGAVGRIEVGYLSGQAYETSLLNPGDFTRLHERLAKLIAEKVASQLSFSKDVQVAGLKRRVESTTAKLRQGEASISDLALELSARFALIQMEGHMNELVPEFTEMEKLMIPALDQKFLTDEDDMDPLTYIALNTREMAIFFEKIDLINDFRVMLVSFEDFYSEGAHDRYGIAELSLDGTAKVPVRRLISVKDLREAKARAAGALAMFRFYKKVNDQQASVYTLAKRLVAHSLARNVLMRLFKLSGSVEHRKRAQDALFFSEEKSQKGRYDIDVLEQELKARLNEKKEKYRPIGWDANGRVLRYLVSPAQIKAMILDAVRKYPDDKTGLPPGVGFVCRPTTGGRTMFRVFYGTSDDNFAHYHLRGYMQFNSEGGCDGILLQGYEPRFANLFMKYHGYFGLYSEEELMGVLRNDMILMARRFMATGLFDPHTDVTIQYIDQNGIGQMAKVQLVALARDVLYRKYAIAQQNHPAYVPYSWTLCLGEVLYRYNYLNMKERLGMWLNYEEKK
ncbi:MAG: hypothetical protein HQL16_08085, partial [Candidatus Omnitrophica bacterium]|nr:hypothetical protein [Candidatus Omnitrophota bacterium]